MTVGCVGGPVRAQCAPLAHLHSRASVATMADVVRTKLLQGIKTLLVMPRAQQVGAARQLWRQVEALRTAHATEAWNTEFGASSLYDALSESTVFSSVYAANAAALRPIVEQRRAWRITEIGGGNGQLMRRLLRPDAAGELVLVDPVPEVHEVVRSALPSGVRLTSIVKRVEEVAELPPSDAVVCSLVLHHVPGLDEHQCREFGILGCGKLNVLRMVRDAIQPRGGVAVVNEADVHCELDLPPGDPCLANNILDSYVRRFGNSLAHDIEHRADRVAADVVDRWEQLLHRWAVGQLQVVDSPLGERDVYELNVAEWVALFRRAALHVQSRRFTDDHCLFVQYVLACEP